mmetsp:Transcript_8502/g.27981  ORF Transcript_8502/g.27981 Transcript_8502/m.27981 type:complete len:218 (-) Transcript_8502:1229-1882(-)
MSCRVTSTRTSTASAAPAAWASRASPRRSSLRPTSPWLATWSPCCTRRSRSCRTGSSPLPTRRDTAATAIRAAASSAAATIAPTRRCASTATPQPAACPACHPAATRKAATAAASRMAGSRAAGTCRTSTHTSRWACTAGEAAACRLAGPMAKTRRVIRWAACRSTRWRRPHTHSNTLAEGAAAAAGWGCRACRRRSMASTTASRLRAECPMVPLLV